MVPLTQETSKPIFIQVFLNLANAQLSKQVKWKIENNDASSIQFKLKIEVEVDTKTALEKVPINGEHIHVQVCRFKFFKWLVPKPCYNRQCWKGASKNLGQRMSKGGPSPKRWPTSKVSKHILDVPQEQPHVDDPKITKQIIKENKLVPSSDQDTSTIVGSIGETTFQVLTSIDNVKKLDNKDKENIKSLDIFQHIPHNRRFMEQQVCLTPTWEGRMKVLRFLHTPIHLHCIQMLLYGSCTI